ALQEKMIQVNELRANGLPTVPSTIGEELATNPFLRDLSSTLQAKFKGIAPVELFAKLRRLKDSF
ncbi:MAG: hydroxyacylglutathione hydrolase C-terminal domain-containing protein, partial [Methylococcales bacterium]